MQTQHFSVFLLPPHAIRPRCTTLPLAKKVKGAESARASKAHYSRAMPQPERIEFSCLCDKSYSLPIREVLFNAPIRCRCGRQLVVSSDVIGLQVDAPVRYSSSILDHFDKKSNSSIRRTA